MANVSRTAEDVERVWGFKIGAHGDIQPSPKTRVRIEEEIRSMVEDPELDAQLRVLRRADALQDVRQVWDVMQVIRMGESTHNYHFSFPNREEFIKNAYNFYGTTAETSERKEKAWNLAHAVLGFNRGVRLRTPEATAIVGLAITLYAAGDGEAPLPTDVQNLRNYLFEGHQEFDAVNVVHKILTQPEQITAHL